MSSLALISAEYSSSSEDEPDKDVVIGSKRKNEALDNEAPSPKLARLPLPAMFRAQDVDPDRGDDPSEHEGRVRSFPHARGNWATFVYVPCSDLVRRQVQELQSSLRGLFQSTEVHPIDEPHLSLSKVVVIHFDWIETLTNSLKTSLRPFPRIQLDWRGVDSLLNEEGTRTFLCLSVGPGSNPQSLEELVSVIDANLGEYDLPAFYRPPKFHISLLWALGDQRAVFNARKSQISTKFQSWLNQSDSPDGLKVAELKCKTGNKIFTFPLEDR